MSRGYYPVVSTSGRCFKFVRSPRLSLSETTCLCKAHTEAPAALISWHKACMEAPAALTFWHKAHTEAPAALTSWYKACTEAPAMAASGHAPRQALLLDGPAVVQGILSRRGPIGWT